MSNIFGGVKLSGVCENKITVENETYIKVIGTVSMRTRCSGSDPTCGRLFRLQLTSQDHTPKVIRRALEKHNMEHVSCHEFTLCQMLNNGKGNSPPLWPPFAQCESRIYSPLVLLIKHTTVEHN